MVKVRLAKNADVPQVGALYVEAGYGGGIDENDTVIVATASEKIVGAVRLCSEDGVTVLRGMQVSETFQRQGIGSQLLKACAGHMDIGQAFCLPYSHLAEFYGAASFEAVSAEELPDFLAKRLYSYLARGQDVIAMRRNGLDQAFQPTPSARLN
ncbi:GNAT family N-acetyltransferase [Duganella sp. Root336D2]|uniref:GNAT family N-acetyltransferase n=1 Tax=Duganella sp. Root336D2 TaxID=1736518 RepID=UPI0006F47783|nr:GNAT family N-acetyltransferase [Duganella sp. Root336D2]KQV51039.1 hypothetical protein ASD07_08965 [Duganella sp. Root336D2]